MADQVMREYRKGNWTVHETVILIAAKKMDEERRMKRSSGDSEGGGRSSSRPAELRWKWVEDYCCSNGCLRSQNQCNDKWDNLMRDYKKVREYECRLSERGGDVGSNSYWKLERHERKEKNLPTNMLLQIYEALVEVVERRSVPRLTSGGGGSGSIMSFVMERERPIAIASVLPSPLPPLLHHHQPSDPTPPPPPPPPPSLPLQLPPPPPPPLHYSDTSEYPDSPAKRRKRGEGEGATSTSINEQVDYSAISTSVSMIAQALQSSEQQEERRHREYLSVLERKLKIEESRNESDKEAISALVCAINGLASSIFTLASEKKPRN